MIEFEIELKDLANSIPELVRTEEVLFLKFEARLNLNIHERIAVTWNLSFKEVVWLALRAENLVQEGRRVRENIAKRRNLDFGQSSKKSRRESSSRVTPSTDSFRSPLRQSSGQQSTVLSSSGPTKARSQY